MAGAGLKVDIKGDTSHFDRAMRGIPGKVTGAVGGLAKIGIAAGAAFAAAFVGAVAVGARGIKGVLDLGGRMSDLADRTGVAAGEIRVLEEAMRLAGVEGADVAKVLQTMGKNVSTALTDGGAAADALQMIGLNAADLHDLSLDRMFGTIGHAIAGMTNDADRARVVMAIMGKSGQPLVTLFKNFDSQVGGARRNLGGLVDVLNRQAGAFDDASDKLGTFGMKIDQFWAGVADKLIPAINKSLNMADSLDLTQYGQKFGEALSDAFTGNPEKLIAIGRVMGAYILAGMEAIVGAGVATIGNRWATGMRDFFVKPWEETGWKAPTSDAPSSLFSTPGQIMSSSLSTENKMVRDALDNLNRTMGKVEANTRPKAQSLGVGYDPFSNGQSIME